MRLVESAYEWSKIPEDLPKGNLVLITAKTTLPTIHRNDPDYPVRIFNKEELKEAARSLAKRPMGLNHSKLIEGAFTVDAQWNESTSSIEALVFLPTPYINLIRRAELEGTPVKYSVEYTWRNENKTDEGVEFIGLCFDRVDLVYGMNAGDMATSGRLVESLESRRRLIEAEGTLIESNEDYEKRLEESADSFLERLGEPFAEYKDWDACIASAKAKGKSNPDAYCGYIKHQTEDKKKKECQECLKLHTVNKGIHPEAYVEAKENKQVPEATNTMTSPSDVILPPVELPLSPQPHENVTSIGAIPDNKGGPIGMIPEEGNPDKNLGKESGNPIVSDSKVLSPDQSNQSVECMSEENKLKESEEPKKEEKKVEPVKEEKKEEVKVPEVKEPEPPKDPVLPTPPVPDPKDIEIKNLTEAVTRLQANVTTADKDKEKAIKDAEKRGKESVIKKIREVIPVSGFFAGNVAVTATKRVVDDVNRKLREAVEEG